MTASPNFLNHATTIANQWQIGVSNSQLNQLCNQAKTVTAKEVGWWGMAQINPIPGDCEYNANQLMSQYRLAEALGLDGILSPELSLMGYPIGDAVVRFPSMLEKQLTTLAECAKKTTTTALLIGFVEPVPGLADSATAHVNRPYYNSVAVCQHGTIQGVIRKQLLPSYHEYHDPRIFRPPSQNEPPIVPWQHGHGLPEVAHWQPIINGIPVGISVCYDWWHNESFVEDSPIATWLAYYPNTQLLLNASASPSRLGKLARRQQIFQQLTERYQLPLLYANQTGGIDEHLFDGASVAISKTGQTIARGPAFQPALVITNPLLGLGEVHTHPEEAQSSPTIITEKAFGPTHQYDLPRAYQAITTGIGDYFAKTGFQRALLGLSGGLDSSITATLAVDALGAANVLGVLMPSELTSQQSDQDARQLASNLGMPVIKLPIADLTSAASQQRQQANQHLEKTWGQPASQHFADDNQQAMSRAMLLRLLGNEYRALPLATSDKSELYLGYATVNGDMSGALAPLGDVVKTKVKALGEWLNRDGERIPAAILTKPPGAELAIDPTTGKTLTAEDALMPYLFADEVIWRIEYRHQWPADMLNEPFAYEATHSLTREQKQAWLAKFVTRMERAVFKWWVAPPILIVDGQGGLTHRDYQHPIVSRLG